MRYGIVLVIVICTGCAAVVGLSLVVGITPVALSMVLARAYMLGGVVLVISVPVVFYRLYGFISPFFVVGGAVGGTIAIYYGLGPWAYVLTITLWPLTVVLSFGAGGIEYAVRERIDPDET